MNRHLKVTALAILAISVLPQGVSAKCRTVYEYYCFERGENNKCLVWERQSREVCDDKYDGGVNTNPRECFVCYEWHADGSCKKTHKVDC